MCEVSDKLVNIGKEIGRKEGLETGRKEGLETGRKEGLEQGFEISRKSTITNMHKLGFSIHEIAAVIGISEDQIPLYLELSHQ